MFSNNQRREVMINNYTGTTAADLDVIVTNGKGGAVASGSSLLFKHVLDNGDIKPSEVIKPEMVRSVSKTISVPKVLPSAEFTMATSTAGYKHQVIVTIENWDSKSCEHVDENTGFAFEDASSTAASLAFDMAESLAQNYKNYEFASGKKVLAKTAGWTIVTDTPDAAGELNITTGACYVDKLYASTALAAKDSTAVATSGYEKIWENPIFTIYNSDAGKVILIGKEQPFLAGRKDYEVPVFRVHGGVYHYDEKISTIDVTSDGGTSNPLQAERVAALEWYANLNTNSQDAGVGFPYNLPTYPKADASGEYLVSYLIQFGKKGRGVNYGTDSERTLQVFCKSAHATANSAANLIETSLETALGITLPADGGIIDVNFG